MKAYSNVKGTSVLMGFFAFLISYQGLAQPNEMIPLQQYRSGGPVLPEHSITTQLIMERTTQPMPILK